MAKMFSMFSGIGGFELGLLMSESNVQFVGYSEIDKYAIQVFERHFKGVKNYGDATRINESKLPTFDLLVGGFPCQAFSVAGKQRGFDDTRGTLFFDVARVLKHKQPKHFILENVKGLLSHDSGRTFQTILRVLSDIGYLVQWEVCNSKNYGVPQNRERVYIVGHLRGERRPKVFPIGEINAEDNRNNQPKEITKDMSMPYRVYDVGGLSTTLKALGGGVGAKTGLYQMKGVAYRTRTYAGRGGEIEERKDDVSNAINSSTKDSMVSGNFNPLQTNEKRIRRLTPTECERLQGFPDGWTDGLSDTQRYKCLGNAVTTNVVCEISKRLLREME